MVLVRRWGRPNALQLLAWPLKARFAQLLAFFFRVGWVWGCGEELEKCFSNLFVAGEDLEKCFSNLLVAGEDLEQCFSNLLAVVYQALGCFCLFFCCLLLAPRCSPFLALELWHLAYRSRPDTKFQDHNDLRPRPELQHL